MWGHRAASWALALRPEKSCGPAQRLPNVALWTCVLPAASPAPGAQLLTPRIAGSPEGLVRGCQVALTRQSVRPERGAQARPRPHAADPSPRLRGRLGGGETRPGCPCLQTCRVMALKISESEEDPECPVPDQLRPANQEKFRNVGLS